MQSRVLPMLITLTFRVLLASAVGVCDLAMYKLLTHSDKWNSVVWRHLKQIQGSSVLRCGGQCLRTGKDCQAFAINSHNYGYCVLLGGLPQLNHTVWKNPDGDWSVYHVLHEKLAMPVFRVSAGNGVSVYNSWMTGTPSSLSVASTSRDLDLSLPLTAFYKHPLVDEWENWDITEVILSLYTNSHEVVRLRFSGSGTSKTSWFSLSNLLSSPWTDLNVNAEVNYFTVSLEGYPNHYRRFYINSHFGGCPADEGWLIVLDGSDACSWTVKAAYPTFDYALGSQMGLWGDACTSWTKVIHSQAGELDVEKSNMESHFSSQHEDCNVICAIQH